MPKKPPSSHSKIQEPLIKNSDVKIEPPAGPHLGDWNLLRSFLAIYETGTLTQAAIRLNTTQPNMGRHLRELEAHIGETLFVRRPGKLEPNSRARELFEATSPIAIAIREAERVFTGDGGEIAGTVRLAVSEVFAYFVMPKIIAPMLHEQAQLEIELSVSNLSDNLLRRDADIAVRFFRPEQSDIIARKLGQVEFGLFAHEDFIAKFGEPDTFEVPKQGFLTGFDKEPFPLAQSIRGEAPAAPLRFRFRCDSNLARQAIVECGGGIGMFPLDIAATRPALRRVLTDRVKLVQEVWLCAHEELRRSKRMRFVWDRVGAGIEEYLAQ